MRASRFRICRVLPRSSCVLALTPLVFGQTLEQGADLVRRLELSTTGAHGGVLNPLTIDAIVQQAYLKASNTGFTDHFGRSVAVSGNTVVVGAPQERSGASGVDGDQSDNSAGNAGAAYVFVRNGTSWSQEAYLKASNTDFSDYFGSAVAVSGDTVVIGAPSEDSDATGVDGDQGNASVNFAAGAAYVFVRNGTTWSQQAYLKASNTGRDDGFGTCVAVSGDTVVVSAPREDSSATGVDGDQGDNSTLSAGAVYVFVRDGATWSQEAYLKASNTEQSDGFGTALAVSGDTLVAGAPFEDSDATGVDGDQGNASSGFAAGAAYVFVRNGTSWSQQAYLKASTSDQGDRFGETIAISGDTIAVGTVREDSHATGVDGDQNDNSFMDSGAGYVFVRNGATWSQEAYLKASNTDSADWFGDSVAVSGDAIVVGASNEDSGASGIGGDESDNDSNDPGAAYLFVRDGTTWTQAAYLKASDSDDNDRFGFAVALAGDTIVVGALLENSSATGVNGDDNDEQEPDSGAAYVFDFAPDIGTRFCDPAVPNSAGTPGVMIVNGSMAVSNDNLLLVADDLPTNSNIGYFIMGTGMNTFVPQGSAGPICVTPGLKRYLPPVGNTNEFPGGFSREVGTSGSISGLITAGSTWSFQAWHRDSIAGTSNLTDAVSVTFR